MRDDVICCYRDLPDPGHPGATPASLPAPLLPSLLPQKVRGHKVISRSHDSVYRLLVFACMLQCIYRYIRSRHVQYKHALDRARHRELSYIKYDLPDV